MAGKGASLVESTDVVYEGRPQRENIVNSVGAGDSMVAGSAGERSHEKVPVKNYVDREIFVNYNI